jgi:acyl dehydratase
MPFTYDEVIARRVDDVAFRYEDTRVLLYNLGVGMGRDPFDAKEAPFFFERPALRAVPTLASVLWGGANPLAGVDLNLTMILHGEQRLSLYRPFPPSADLVSSIWVSEVVDKGPDKGAIITTTTETRLASGEPLFSTDNVLFARADGGCGGPSKSKVSPHVLPERAPDIVHVTETRPDQALLYRLNGDRNPLHAEPEFAKRAGFPGPILHGLCSYGIACRAVLASVCDYDPARMKSFDVRFTSPVFPGETIHTDIWVDGEVVSFRSRIEARGVTSINNGRCLISA